jgi:hypothetical protein
MGRAAAAAAPALLKAQRDADPVVRRSATAALLRIVQRESVRSGLTETTVEDRPATATREPIAQ